MRIPICVTFIDSLLILRFHADLRHVEGHGGPLSFNRMGKSIMPLKKPLTPVVPQLIRKMPPSFAWVDHRLRTRQFLVDFEPEEFALYFFLSLAADQQGLSCWRLDVIERAMPVFRFHQLRQAREQLFQKRLLAFRAWNLNDPDGTYQLLPVPNVKPAEPVNDLQTTLGNIIKTVS